MAQATCTYRKTKSGQWVVCGPASTVKAGATVTVVKKSGETKDERIVSVGKPFSSNGVQMVYGYTDSRDRASGSGRRSCTCGMHRSYRECRTGGNCSSFGDGGSCGGCDCDGY